MEVFWTSQHRECKYGGKLRNMIMCIYRQIYQTKRAIILKALKAEITSLQNTIFHYYIDGQDVHKLTRNLTNKMVQQILLPI